MLFRLFYGFRMSNGIRYTLSCFTLIRVESISDKGILCVCEDEDSLHYGKEMLVAFDSIGQLERVS